MVHESRDQFDERPLRVLFVVHGHEPAEWTARACRLVSAWRNARVRLLGIVDVPSPPFTSLIPPARRRDDAARGGWTQDEEQRVERTVARVLLTLAGRVGLVRQHSSPRGLAGTLGEQARDWRADVVLVAASTGIAHSWCGLVPSVIACAGTARVRCWSFRRRRHCARSVPSPASCRPPGCRAPSRRPCDRRPRA